jgi:uncharacterized membrane protein
MKKSNENIIMIVPIFCVFAITQMLFFWLAPDVECFLVVYAFVTVLSIIHLVMTYMLSVTKGIRNSAGTILVGSVIWIIYMVLSAVLIGFDVSVKTAAFSLIIVFFVYLIGTLTMYASMGMVADPIGWIDETHGTDNLESNNYIDK